MKAYKIYLFFILLQTQTQTDSECIDRDFNVCFTYRSVPSTSHWLSHLAAVTFQQPMMHCICVYSRYSSPIWHFLKGNKSMVQIHICTNRITHPLKAVNGGSQDCHKNRLPWMKCMCCKCVYFQCCGNWAKPLVVRFSINYFSWPSF